MNAAKWILPGASIVLVGSVVLLGPVIHERRERERAAREEAERVARIQAEFQRIFEDHLATFRRHERYLQMFRLQRKQRAEPLTAAEEKELADLKASLPPE